MSRPQQRRGLGRGLGSLIPTARRPRAPEPTGETADQDSTELAPVAGAYFADLPIAQVVPNAVQPRQVFDEEAMAELVHSIREVGLLQPVVVRKTGPEQFELVMGERRWRAVAGGRADHDPGHRPGDRRHRHAPRRAAGEPAPVAAQPAGGGFGLRPAARRLLLHPRGAGQPDRPLASADQQHPAAAQAQPGRPAPGRCRRPLGRACPVTAGHRGPRPAGPAGPAGRRRRHQRARPRGDRRRR